MCSGDVVHARVRWGAGRRLHVATAGCGPAALDGCTPSPLESFHPYQSSLPSPLSTETSRPAARVLINALALHSAADAARIFLENLIRRLPECWPEAQVLVIARHGAEIPSEARVEVIRVGSSSSGVLRVADELVRLRRIVRRIAPDVTVNPNESVPGGIRGPVVVVAQNLFFHCPDIGPLRRGPWRARLRSRLQFAFYRRRMPRAYVRADAIVPVSEHAARELAEHAGLDLSKVHAVHYGADRLPMRPRSEQAGRRSILVVGALAHYKRLDSAVEALALLVADGDDYELCLAGGAWPGEEAILRSLAVSRGVEERVKFLGPVEGDQLAQLFATSHAGLSLSACESFGIPVVEGMRAGLPHVVADEPWSEETVADCAVRVDARDPGSIAAGIRRLGVPEEWERMARLGRERAARYTWQANAGGVAAAAIRVVEQGAASAR
jgi:glycosyltransferase involved in cell wall biosynthesis